MLSASPDPYETLGPALQEGMACYEQGDWEGAARILQRGLRDIDPSSTPPHPIIAPAGLIFARLTDDVDSALRWAWYGYQATLQLDTDAESIVFAASTLAGALTDREQFRIAALLWEQVAARHQQAGAHHEHAEARLSMAEALQKTGSCGAAVQQATIALDAYPADENLTAITAISLVRALRILGMCDRTQEALALIRQWQPRLPATDIDRTLTRFCGGAVLGFAEPVLEHRSVCASRLDRRLDLHPGGTDGCPSRMYLRRLRVRAAFLAALDGPDSSPASDLDLADEAIGCQCTASPTGLRRFSVKSVRANLIQYLAHVQNRLRFGRAVHPDGGTR
jgi:tetratricopeptide (TPR) repeat protein